MKPPLPFFPRIGQSNHAFFVGQAWAASWSRRLCIVNNMCFCNLNATVEKAFAMATNDNITLGHRSTAWTRLVVYSYFMWTYNSTSLTVKYSTIQWFADKRRILRYFWINSKATSIPLSSIQWLSLVDSWRFFRVFCIEFRFWCMRRYLGTAFLSP